MVLGKRITACGGCHIQGQVELKQFKPHSMGTWVNMLFKRCKLGCFAGYGQHSKCDKYLHKSKRLTLLPSTFYSVANTNANICFFSSNRRRVTTANGFQNDIRVYRID